MIYYAFLFFILALLLLVRLRLINIDMSFPWFVSLIVLAVLSTNEEFVLAAAEILDVKNPPLVIILLTLFIMLGLITVLAIYITELRRRINILTEKVALYDIDRN